MSSLSRTTKRKVVTDPDVAPLWTEQEHDQKNNTKTIIFPYGETLSIPFSDIQRSRFLFALDLQDTIELKHTTKQEYEDAMRFMNENEEVNYDIWDQKLVKIIATLLYLDYERSMIASRISKSFQNSEYDDLIPFQLRRQMDLPPLTLPDNCLQTLRKCCLLQSIERDDEEKCLEVTNKWDTDVYLYAEDSLSNRASKNDPLTELQHNAHVLLSRELYHFSEKDFVFVHAKKCPQLEAIGVFTFSFIQENQDTGIRSGIPGYYLPLDLLFEPVLDIQHSGPQCKQFYRVFWIGVLGLNQRHADILSHIWIHDYDNVRRLVHAQLIQKAYPEEVAYLMIEQHPQLKCPQHGGEHKRRRITR